MFSSRWTLGGHFDKWRYLRYRREYDFSLFTKLKFGRGISKSSSVDRSMIDEWVDDYSYIWIALIELA